MRIERADALSAGPIVAVDARDTELLHHIDDALNTLGVLVRHAPADQWRRPTPCREWNVGQLIDHLIGGVGSCARRMSDEPIPTYESLSSPAAAPTMFEASARATMQALSAPGALQRTYHVPWGDAQGRTMAEFLLVECVVHGWDLAHATEQLPAFADATVALAHRLALTSLAGSPREPAFFGPEVVLDANPSELESLVALLGRDPR